VYLVDTSVWVEVFRKPSRIDFKRFLNPNDIVTCLPVIQEVLQGFREQIAFVKARDAMFSFPVIESPLRLQIFEEAVQLYRSARRVGLSVRSGVDCVIAACAIRHNLEILHIDRDFDLLSRVSPLSERRL
jgi:predicted nucleic acid-binding protein